MSHTGNTIAVIDYGMGNIHSILKALRLYHDDVRFTADPATLRSAAALVLPGDGAFGAAMMNLRGAGLDVIIHDHVRESRPLFGVCIGFQVLFADSDETHDGPGLIKGLGLVPGHVRRFCFADARVRVPHMGWNRISGSNGQEGDYMYFIHSYRAEGVVSDYVDTTCEYAGDRFVSSIRHGSLFGAQFHPEKSDRAGLALIEGWVRSLGLKQTETLV